MKQKPPVTGNSTRLWFRLPQSEQIDFLPQRGMSYWMQIVALIACGSLVLYGIYGLATAAYYCYVAK